MDRPFLTPEHAMFRQSVRRFAERELVPHHARWEREGMVDRDTWRKAGEAGLLCTGIATCYGGHGADRGFAIVVAEEMARLGLSGPYFHLHSDIVAPYIANYGTEAQKQRWLPPMARGETIGAIAMTEPGGGSDLQAMQTKATRDGDGFRLSGAKTFISNGQLADLVIVAAKTDPDARAKGVSLFLVDTTRPGFRRGRKLEKMGSHAQDTSELFFDDVLLDEGDLLGPLGGGFAVLMQELAWERMLIALRACTLAEAALDWTGEHVRNRKTFGKSLGDHQHVRFRLARQKANAVMLRHFVDSCLAKVMSNDLDATTAAVAKYQSTELLMTLLDECVQLHGGYGYMWEYPICRAYADSRYTRIAGGSNEIMLELIARTL